LCYQNCAIRRFEWRTNGAKQAAPFDVRQPLKGEWRNSAPLPPRLWRRDKASIPPLGLATGAPRSIGAEALPVKMSLSMIDRQCESWPVVWNARLRSYLIDIDGKADGRFVGAIVYYADENIFEAWRYLPKAPVCLGTNLRSHAEALALFYQREKVPSPPPGWLRRRFMRG